ncbi:MAG TPA: 4-hydroxy-tetrahydrodipicolinate reductase [Chthonomonadales bacterium]|nr:4-hydroxy-tetrahydrodipicolinate reductase [Chthonomonadales bacterium]
MISVAVAGAAGRMGREVLRAVRDAADMRLVAAVDRAEIGADAGALAGGQPCGLPVVADLGDALRQSGAQVLVDFTVPASALGNLRIAAECGVRPVVGTTGLTEADLAQAAAWLRSAGIGGIVAPNFAIGAVLMMRFAAQAARYLPDAEVIELHHERKLDSPSGTALATARAIAESRAEAPVPAPDGTVEKIPGARGAVAGDVHIHSVRLPGLVAHQEVLFGGPGQTLSIRHDSIDRRSFMPGVLLAIRKAPELSELVVGLDRLL